MRGMLLEFRLLTAFQFEVPSLFSRVVRIQVVVGTGAFPIGARHQPISSPASRSKLAVYFFGILCHAPIAAYPKSYLPGNRGNYLIFRPRTTEK
ncbi:hypothetical protein Dform_00094 [Dehalogenimonas formicexedens]|uniref:Uncharacterized protein n=1 Tax=Dehalogenimonas formicexedens TaxID=1839801 RepID=A0A1P8F4P4_9CHLR|nr:hypothetical protein Dform_00094 [Dehalogenimonas formicexedens]